jgi:hypothetical protein
MGPKIDPHLILQATGREVSVTGPTGGWDAWEEKATFAVVIGQAHDEDIVLAVGRASANRGAATWSATATVEGAGKLQPGLAFGWALVSVENKVAAGAEWYEPYPWSVYTWLVPGPAPMRSDDAQ